MNDVQKSRNSREDAVMARGTLQLKYPYHRWYHFPSLPEDVRPTTNDVGYDAGSNLKWRVEDWRGSIDARMNAIVTAGVKLLFVARLRIAGGCSVCLRHGADRVGAAWSV